MQTSNSFLGTGWSFPVSFQKKTGVQMTSGEEDIRDSLQILLSTTLGERIMQPQYGCNMDELLFESLSATMNTFITNKIKTAILISEPRVTVNNIYLNSSNEVDGIVLIEIEYTIITTNTRHNIVFPFYKTEGFNF